MQYHKKIRYLCILLIICLVLAVLPEKARAAASTDDELLRAISSDLIPENWLDDLDETVLFSEYSTVLSNAVELWDSNHSAEWNEIVRLASASDEPMETEDGYLMLSYLWVMMGQAEDFADVVYGEYNDPPDSIMGELSWNYEYFPDWETVVYPGNCNYMWGGIAAFLNAMSPISGKRVATLDAGGSLGARKPFTRDKAIRSLMRMLENCRVELNPDWRDYVALDEAGTYDKSIITDAMLTAPSNLPEVTQSVLPSSWRGAGISTRKGSAEQYTHFSETDVRFLAENGFNFTRLFYVFSTIRYPDYPEDPRIVNENELKELDQLLAWCMKYDIHLQISQRGYMDENGNNTETMPENEAEWYLAKEYWEMLARRYAGIPSKYLSFDLCNEIEPERNDASALNLAKEGLATVAEAVHAADPQRVMLYSFQGSPNMDWVDAVGQLGIAIGCHPYKPSFITAADRAFTEKNPYAEPCWPQPYFPMGTAMAGGAPVILRGDISGATLSMHIMTSSEHPQFDVFADGHLLESFTPTEGIPGDGEELYYMDNLYSVQIPTGIQEVSIQVMDGEYARFDTFILEKAGIKTVIVPSDTCDYPDFTDPLPLTVNGDGTYHNDADTYFDEDLIYEMAVKPSRDIAERYGVGFMCNEFGMYGTDVHWDINVVTAFHKTYLAMLEKHSIPWCYCELFNIYPKHLIVFYGDESQWSGATVEEITYTFDDGHSETIKICKELVDVFREHN